LAGCEKIFTDIASGSKGDRLGLAEAVQYLRPGDTLVVWKLERFNYFLVLAIKHKILAIINISVKLFLGNAAA
jgi:DNA invertase Pin-like site-specific DNA recombinase